MVGQDQLNWQTALEENGEERLKGKVAIITGGARGIGAATANLFAIHGAFVIIADILDDLGQQLADALPATRYIHCDVTKESDVEAAVQLALSWHGHLDIMFNNAGIAGPVGSITGLEMEKLQQVLAVNVSGMVHGIKHAARAMMASGGGGCIICTSSSAAMMGGLAGHAYSLSKGALVALVRSAACELGEHGIRVNCISPHGVPSEMLLGAYRVLLGREDIEEELSRIRAESGVLRGRGASLNDVAQAALFLAGDGAGFVTGHNLVVDGGYTAATRSTGLIYQ